MARTVSALVSVLLATVVAAQRPATQRSTPPRTPADSLAAVVEPLFSAAKYDSILALIPGVIRRAEATHDSVLLDRAITQRGRVFLMRGALDPAERDLDVGIHIAESIRDTVGLMPAVHFRGFVYSSRGMQDEALRCYQRRLLLAERAHSPVDEAWARASIGYVYNRRGEHAAARAEYLRAIELFRSSGFERLELTPLLGLGNVASYTGDEREAIRCYKRVWVVSRELGDKVNEMWASNNLGSLEEAHGDLSRASSYTQRAYDLARELKSATAMVIPATNIAERAVEMGDFEGAEAILQETREACRAQGANDYLSIVDFRIGELRMSQGRYAAAGVIWRRLLANPGALDPPAREFSLLNLARTLAMRDSLQSAVDLITNEIDRPDRPSERDAMPFASMLLSGLYLQNNDPAHALECVTQARRSATASGRARDVIGAMLRESVCLRLLGRNEGASQTLYAALDSLEAFRGGISTAEWREVYGQGVSDEVVEACRVLQVYPPDVAQSVRDEAFFDAMQRVKTRTLLDRITEPRFGSENIEGRWSKRFATMDDLQAALEPGELMLDFYAGRECTIAAAVTADSVQLLELPGPDSPFADRVALFRSVLSSANAPLRAQYPPERMTTMQRALGRDLLGAVASAVLKSTRVIVAPDGFIASVPFGALVLDDDARPLIADRDVVEVPSASVLVLRRSTERAECLAHPKLVALGSGEPQLSGARNEVNDLARRYGHVNAVIDIAGVASFEEATSQCDVLHVAAHAYVVDRSPWESGIRLDAGAPVDSSAATVDADPDTSSVLPAADSLLVARTFQADPYVRAWQIAQLSLPAKLAVLAACETAGGRVTSGEGTLGLTAAFLSAGVPVVVSSLWAIDDQATAKIMRAFYRNLSRGETVARALRLAQTELAAVPKYAHPFFWAGFTVVGDGSMVVEIDEHRAPRPIVLLAALGAGLLVVTALVIRRRRARASVG